MAVMTNGGHPSALTQPEADLVQHFCFLYVLADFLRKVSFSFIPVLHVDMFTSWLLRKYSEILT